MSTATIAMHRPVRPRDMAEAIAANEMEGERRARIVEYLLYVPNKVRDYAGRIYRASRIQRIIEVVRNAFRQGLDVVGRTAAGGFALTSVPGQWAVRKVASGVFKVGRWLLVKSYRVVTKPLRWFEATNKVATTLDNFFARTIGDAGVVTNGVSTAAMYAAPIVSARAPWTRFINSIFGLRIVWNVLNRFLPGPWALAGRIVSFIGTTLFAAPFLADSIATARGIDPADDKTARRMRSWWRREKELAEREGELATINIDDLTPAELAEVREELIDVLEPRLLVIDEATLDQVEAALEDVNRSRKLHEDLSEALAEQGALLQQRREHLLKEKNTVASATTTTTVETSVVEPPAGGNGVPPEGPSMPRLGTAPRGTSQGQPGGPKQHGPQGKKSSPASRRR